MAFVGVSELNMRVLIIGKMFPPSTRARAQQLARVALALDEAGCDIRVVAGLNANDEKPRWPFPVHYVTLGKAIANPFSTTAIPVSFSISSRA